MGCSRLRSSRSGRRAHRYPLRKSSRHAAVRTRHAARVRICAALHQQRPGGTARRVKVRAVCAGPVQLKEALEAGPPLNAEFGRGASHSEHDQILARRALRLPLSAAVSHARLTYCNGGVGGVQARRTGRAASICSPSVLAQGAACACCGPCLRTGAKGARGVLHCGPFHSWHHGRAEGVGSARYAARSPQRAPRAAQAQRHGRRKGHVVATRSASARRLIGGGLHKVGAVLASSSQRAVEASEAAGAYLGIDLPNAMMYWPGEQA